MASEAETWAPYCLKLVKVVGWYGGADLHHGELIERKIVVFVGKMNEEKIGEESLKEEMLQIEWIKS